MIFYSFIWFSFGVFITNTLSARILAVFPTPSISHQVVFRPLTQELAKRGHEVVVITPDPAFPKGHTPDNLTEIDVHDQSYSLWNKMIVGNDLDKPRDWLELIRDILFSLTIIFEEQTKTEDVQNLLSQRELHFDLLLLEACVRSTLGISYVFKSPVIQISSLGSAVNNYGIIGAPTHPILYPSLIRDRLYNLTMWEKVIELIKEFQFKNLLQDLQELEDISLKRIFGNDIPPLEELYKNVDMLFLNVHPIWENNHPVSPNVIYLGGLHQISRKILTKDLQLYLDSSKNGVIYFSLGTNVKPSMVPSEKLKVITDVFSKLPYDILMKWDSDNLPGRTKNIKLSKWLPQSELLRHPKVLLFITQGGLQSTDEAISAAVPLIGLPMLGDQWYNVEQYVHHRIGVKLDINTLTTEAFKAAIELIITDKSYAQNIAKLRALMQDQPQSPLDRAVWWIEYLLRHGGAKHFKAPSANITWTEYLELRLAFTVAATLTLFLFLIFVITKRIWIWICIFSSEDNIYKPKRS